MDKKTFKTIILSFRKRHLIYFITLFVILFPLFLSTYKSVSEPLIDLYVSCGQYFAKNHINNKQELQLELNIKKDDADPTVTSSQLVFLNTYNGVGYQAITYKIDNTRNALIPLVIFLALALATPVIWKSRITKIIMGFLIMHLFIFFKFFLLTFNVIKLPSTDFLLFADSTKKFLYYFNYFILMTGDSLFLTLPVIIWFVLFFNNIKQIYIEYFPVKSTENI